MGTLSFEPLLPSALWLALAVMGAALLAWYGWRRPGSVTRRRWAGILALMATGLALVLLVLLNPTWVAPVAPPAGKPLLTLLVDSTASMATADGSAGEQRYRAAVRLAQEFLKEVGDRYEVRVATFTDTVTAAEANGLEDRPPQGMVTDLAAAISGSLEADRPAGQAIILLSDGIHNGGGGAERVLEAARFAKAMACPVYTRTFGGDAAVKDLAVEFRTPQELAFVGQKVPLSVRLRQRGYGGGQATLVMTNAGQELERRSVPLPPSGGDSEVRFLVSRPKPGLFRFEVRAEPLPGEASQANNAGTLLLRVMDKPVRVLLLEGKPYWDAKFLARTLLDDPSIELDSVVRLGEGRYLRRTVRRPDPATNAQEEWKVETAAAPALVDAAALRAYQVIVLGRDADVFLTDAALVQVRAWLARDGGSLVCFRGQPTTQVGQRLGQLLPLRWAPASESRFQVALTDRGRDLRWLAAEALPDEGLIRLPTLATAGKPEQPKPLAVVLATAKVQPAAAENPAVTYQPYGSGRVVVIEGAGMWRWAFLPPQQQKQDDVYRALWHGLLRWLASSADLLPGQKLALRSDKVRFTSTEPASATLLIREEDAGGPVPTVELTGDGNGRQVVKPVALGDEPGVFRVAFGKLPEGCYQARVAGAPENDPSALAAFDVRSPSDEQLDLTARPDLMARIAQESGGAVLEGDGAKGVVQQFQEHRERSRPQRVVRMSAWDRWWVLLGVLAVWGWAWGLRRSGGLI